MPNPLIYASTTPDHSLHKGDVAVGVNSVEYDPSDGWVNGAIPTNWDYVIYKTTSGANPNIFAPANEQEFYNFVLMQGGSASDVTSVGAALAWIATQSDLLAIHSSLPNMVTDGLILALDAKQVSSYPTTGTDWYDISGANNNGEMINGLSFNSGGWMDFDGSDDYVWVPNNNGTMDGWNDQQTIIVWEYHDFTTSRRNIWNQAYGGFGTWTHEQGGNVNYYFGDAGANAQPYVSANSSTTVRGQWNMLCVTRDLTTVNWYQNGVLTSTRGNPYGSLTNTTAGVSIGTGYTGVRWQGKMSKILAYTKALTPSEVLQNYYQAPIVTDGLVFAVDAGNLVSYENGDTITNSLAGSSTGTLTNGVGFDSANGGYWDFDGTNDYISLTPSSIPTGNEISISFWNNGDNFAASSIIGASSNNAQDLNIHLPWSNKNIYWDCGSPFNRIQKLATDAEILGWHNWVFTKNAATGIMRIYLDGIEWHSGSGLTSTIPSMIVARLGSYFTNQLYHNGQIAQCLIHNKELTAAEVTQNFQAQSSRFI